MLDWFTGELWSAALHWLAYWGTGAILIGGMAAAAWFSPLFKGEFLGAAIGAAALLFLQGNLVSFFPKDPQICQHPPTDPNGPVQQCFHKTDDARGFGYWGACDQ